MLQPARNLDQERMGSIGPGSRGAGLKRLTERLTAVHLLEAAAARTFGSKPGLHPRFRFSHVPRVSSVSSGFIFLQRVGFISDARDWLRPHTILLRSYLYPSL